MIIWLETERRSALITGRVPRRRPRYRHPPLSTRLDTYPGRTCSAPARAGPFRTRHHRRSRAHRRSRPDRRRRHRIAPPHVRIDDRTGPGRRGRLGRTRREPFRNRAWVLPSLSPPACSPSVGSSACRHNGDVHRCIQCVELSRSSETRGGAAGRRQSPWGGVPVAFQLVSSSVSGYLVSRA